MEQIIVIVYVVEGPAVLLRNNPKGPHGLATIHLVERVLFRSSPQGSGANRAGHHGFKLGTSVGWRFGFNSLWELYCKAHTTPCRQTKSEYFVFMIDSLECRSFDYESYCTNKLITIGDIPPAIRAVVRVVRSGSEGTQPRHSLRLVLT
jgi:hypothetical protein